MAARMKKIFHRNKNDDSEEPRERTRALNNAQSNPAIRTSLYEDTAPAAPPQTGNVPLQGNDSSVVLQQGRKPSVRSSRSRRSSGGQENLPYRVPTPGRTPPPPANAVAGAYGPYQQAPAIPMGGQRSWSRSALDQDFSVLNLGNEQSPTTLTQITTTTHVTPQGPMSASNSSQAQGYDTRTKGGIRKVTQDNTRQPAYNGPAPPDDYDGHLAPQKSIPRKQVGTNANAPYSSGESSATSNGQNGHSCVQNASKPLPSAPLSPNGSYENEEKEALPQPSNVLDRSRRICRGVNGPRDAQDVINRAKSNTHDTSVFEKVAPAIVHETVHRDVHHIREERITREVHNHDVYHRILPVIDVEVLPPRHFLPVEGGGLVEVTASEVPGRGNNWVIAETASKIPSDQAVPHGARQFTARTFPGREGDDSTLVAPGGHQITEQTWVHPPELESGARDTGQSWPMVFGDDTPEKASHKHTNSKSSKRKSPTKNLAAQTSPAQRVDGTARGV